MSEGRTSGCFAALVALVILAALGVVCGGIGVGAWFWWSSRIPTEGIVEGGPWTLRVDNPNDVPISVTCALESSPPVEVAAHAKADLQITTLPVFCTGSTATGAKVLELTSSAPPEDGVWTVTATVVAGPAEATTAPADPAPEATPEPETRPDEPEKAQARKEPTRTTPKTGASAAPATEAVSAPPAKAAILSFRYPSGPKFVDIQVAIDGRSLGTRPSGATVTPGSHTIQFYKDGVVNISCPVDVDEDGRVVSLSRKLGCPSLRE